MSYRLAIFDFDGTLADSFPYFVAVFNQVADRHAFNRIHPEELDSLRKQGLGRSCLISECLAGSCL